MAGFSFATLLDPSCAPANTRAEEMDMKPSRRRLLAGAAAWGALGTASRALAAPLGSTGALGFAELPDGTLESQLLYALPGKVPLIKKTYRPPNFETPVEYFR